MDSGALRYNLRIRARSEPFFSYMIPRLRGGGAAIARKASARQWGPAPFPLTIRAQPLRVCQINRFEVSIWRSAEPEHHARHRVHTDGSRTLRRDCACECRNPLMFPVEVSGHRDCAVSFFPISMLICLALGAAAHCCARRTKNSPASRRRRPDTLTTSRNQRDAGPVLGCCVTNHLSRRPPHAKAIARRCMAISEGLFAGVNSRAHGSREAAGQNPGQGRALETATLICRKKFARRRPKRRQVRKRLLLLKSQLSPRIVGSGRRTDTPVACAESKSCLIAVMNNGCGGSMSVRHGSIRQAARSMTRARKDCALEKNCHYLGGPPGQSRRRGRHRTIAPRQCLKRSAKASGVIKRAQDCARARATASACERRPTHSPSRCT